MTLGGILSRYSSLSARAQLNVASFKEMKDELIRYCNKKNLQKERESLERICNSYLDMRDGCEINSATFKDATAEMSEFLSIYKK